MGFHDDDLTAWQNDPIVRALNAPGSAAELGGESEALAAFRAAAWPRKSRRLAGRLGVGGATLGVAIALSGGAAAAYTSSLPQPVQGFAHEVTGWMGAIKIPSPHRARSHATVAVGSHAAPSVPSSPLRTPTGVTAAARPSSRPAHGSRKPAKRKKPPSTRPVTSPGATPTSTPTPTPTPTPTVTGTPVAGSITISLSATTVPVGGTVTIYGQLATSTGAPVAGENVWLLERSGSQTGPMQVASGVTGDDGSVTLDSTALSHTTRLRLVTDNKLRSAALPVVVAPTITASVTPQGAATTIQVGTSGADPGDTVAIQVRRGGGWREVAANQIDSSGGATFGVPTPVKRAAHYRAVLGRTNGHGAAVTRFTVPPG